MGRYNVINNVEKFNPNHDNLGRFSTADGATFFTIQTKDPKKQYMADMAIARQKMKQEQTSVSNNGFMPAKTIDEAANYATKELGFKSVNYGKADIKTVNMINEQITEIYKQYPEMKGAVKYIENYQSQNAFAAASMDMNGNMSLHVGGSMQHGYDNTVESYKKGVESGFHPANTDEKAIVWHEFGHLYAYAQAKKANGLEASEVRGFFDNQMSNALAAKKSRTFEKEVLRKASKELKQTQTATKGNISIYATKKVSETFAEAFAEYHCSPNPRKDCIAMMKAAGITTKGKGSIDNITEVN